jgi:DNA adenine methylase
MVKQKIRTPINYYGGKTSMLPILTQMVPSHTVYTEVFFGGGALFFAKEPCKNETINDINDLVINFYRQLKTNYLNLKSEIDSTLYARSVYDKAILILVNKALFSALELAWAFWVVCNFSYNNDLNGGMKYSNNQSVSPPETLIRKKKRFTEHLVSRIENAHIENKDAITILNNRNVKDAFHYIDPPYMNANQGHYAGYNESAFIKLLTWLEQCKGKFLLSNYSSPVLTEFIEKNSWKSSEHTFRNKGVRKQDKSKLEIIVWNYQYNLSLFNHSNENK